MKIGDILKEPLDINSNLSKKEKINIVNEVISVNVISCPLNCCNDFGALKLCK